VVDLVALKRAARSVGAKPWAWWTSNSFVRLTFENERDGGALSASVCRDGVATVNASEEVRQFIAEANPAVVLELVEALEQLRDWKATVFADDRKLALCKKLTVERTTLAARVAELETQLGQQHEAHRKTWRQLEQALAELAALKVGGPAHG
jgi:uncharacterized protein YlxW (UPF0749 family)